MSSPLSLFFRELSAGERKHKQLDELPPGAFRRELLVAADVTVVTGLSGENIFSSLGGTARFSVPA
jgi:hypothetical protein